MAKKDFVLLFLFGVFMLLSVASLFYRSIILEDFEILVTDEEMSSE